MGVTHRVVNYETASRDGSVFEAAVRKYGVFNPTKPSCTRVLKEDPITSYVKSLGWMFGESRNHQMAIGIRVDEADRMSVGSVRKYGATYPMIDWGMTKRDVAIEMKSWPFDLEIPGDHFGNCKWCWKKTDRKLYTLAIEDPSVFDVPKRLEARYGRDDAKAGRKCCDETGRATFFRKHRSAEEIMREADETEFNRYSDDPHDHAYDFDEQLDVGGGCGESCEVWSDVN